MGVHDDTLSLHFLTSNIQRIQAVRSTSDGIHISQLKKVRLKSLIRKHIFTIKWEFVMVRRLKNLWHHTLERSRPSNHPQHQPPPSDAFFVFVVPRTQSRWNQIICFLFCFLRSGLYGWNRRPILFFLSITPVSQPIKSIHLHTIFYHIKENSMHNGGRIFFDTKGNSMHYGGWKETRNASLSCYRF
jgi:hypothetical protein